MTRTPAAGAGGDPRSPEPAGASEGSRNAARAGAGAPAAPTPRRPRLGLLVNPVAGLGGRVGLGGTDGPGLIAEALARGAHAEAAERAAAALRALAEAWADGPLPDLLVARGPMGVAAVERTEWPAGRLAPAVTVLDTAVGDPSTADDTTRCARAMILAGVDLLLFAGGDGTARDVCAAIGDSPVVLGVPAGVKIQSAAFATSPAAAGRLAAGYVRRRDAPTALAEVIDLEAASGPGLVPRLHGYLRVPRDRLVQGRKTPSPPDATMAASAIAEDVVAGLAPATRCILGPGTTVAAIAARLGVPKTLVGVDVVQIGGAGAGAVAGASSAPGSSPARLLVADAAERDVLAAVEDGAGDGVPVVIVVTPIGGQGFLFGRGNQPISPAVIRAVGAGGIIVVATAAKLAKLGGRPLLVDTGDPDLDAAIAGPIRVVTGYRERAVVQVMAG